MFINNDSSGNRIIVTHASTLHTVTKERCTNSVSPAFASTAVQPWSKAGDRLTGTQREYSDLRQLVDKKDAEIESLKRQLCDKEQLISEVEETVESFKKKLIQVH